MAFSVTQLGHDRAFAPDDATEPNYVTRRKRTGRQGVDHRAKDNEILATNRCDLDVCSCRKCGIELLRRIQTGKSAAAAYYSGFFSGLHLA